MSRQVRRSVDFDSVDMLGMISSGNHSLISDPNAKNVRGCVPCGKMFRWMIRDGHFLCSFLIALPCAVLASLLEVFQNHVAPGLLEENGSLISNDAYTTMTFLVGFIVIFRTQQAYMRYWEGCETIYHISGDWFDAASSLCAFSSRDDDKEDDVLAFKHRLVRLLSLLNALIYDELENVSEGQATYALTDLPIIDVGGLDHNTLLILDQSDSRVEVAFQWIQNLVIECMRAGTLDVPAPILTRAFQELGAGMLKFHGALKLAHMPFPFAYTATLQVLLWVHWFVTPIGIVTLTESTFWAGFITFLQVFMIWSFNGIASELENPFKFGMYGIDTKAKQSRQNRRLLCLLERSTQHIPSLTEFAVHDFSDTDSMEGRMSHIQTVLSSQMSSQNLSDGTLEKVATLQPDVVTTGRLGSKGTHSTCSNNNNNNRLSDLTDASQHHQQDRPSWKFTSALDLKKTESRLEAGVNSTRTFDSGKKPSRSHTGDDAKRPKSTRTVSFPRDEDMHCENVENSECTAPPMIGRGLLSL